MPHSHVPGGWLDRSEFDKVIWRGVSCTPQLSRGHPGDRCKGQRHEEVRTKLREDLFDIRQAMRSVVRLSASPTIVNNPAYVHVRQFLNCQA